MFRDRSLLERLRNPGEHSPTAVEDTGELIRSIIRNLHRILNCRQGHAPAQMDYGIPDATAIVSSGPDAAGEMSRVLRECIAKYEPRLKDVKVTAVEDDDDPLSLRFQISAQLATTRERIPLSLDTLVDASGQIEIHE